MSIHHQLQAGGVLTKQIKLVNKVNIKIPVSIDLANAYNKELAHYEKNNQSGNILDFDSLVKKLTNELKKINAETKVK